MSGMSAQLKGIILKEIENCNVNKYTWLIDVFSCIAAWYVLNFKRNLIIVKITMPCNCKCDVMNVKIVGKE